MNSFRSTLSSQLRWGKGLALLLSLGFCLASTVTLRAQQQDKAPGAALRQNQYVSCKSLADYSEPATYSDRKGRTHSNSTILLPHFQFTDADHSAIANARVAELAAQLERSFADCQAKQSVYSPQANYSLYAAEQILTVIWQGKEAGFAGGDLLQMWSFALPTGEFLSPENFAKRSKLSSDIDSLVEKALYKSCSAASIFAFVPEARQGDAAHLARALQRYWDGEADFALGRNDQGKLLGQLTLALPGDQIDSTVLLPLPEQADKALNPIYSRLLRDQGLEAESANYDALGFFAGACYSEQSIEESLLRLGSFAALYAEGQEPSLCPRLVSKDDFNTVLAGSELYVLIPRYQYATVTQYPLDMIEDKVAATADLERTELGTVPPSAGLSFVLLAQNESDLWPNAEIELRYRSERSLCRPSLSLKDGSTVWAGTARILDLSSFYEEIPSQAEYYPWLLAEHLSSLKIWE